VIFNQLAKIAFIQTDRLLRMSSKYRGIPILLYHQVCDGGLAAKNQKSCIPTHTFEQQMRFLYENKYHVMTLDELTSCLDKVKETPMKCVCIIFDNGHRDNYDNAFPVLKKYGFKATVFIVTGYIGDVKWFSRKSGKWERSHDETDELYYEFLDWDQIYEMNEYGISFQPHTHTHPLLTRIPVNSVREEILRSKSLLEEKLDRPVQFFCYPCGDYDMTVKKEVMSTGFIGACSEKSGYPRINFIKTDRYGLKTIGMVPQYDLLSFKVALTGRLNSYSVLSTLTKRTLNLSTGE